MQTITTKTAKSAVRAALKFHGTTVHGLPVAVVVVPRGTGYCHQLVLACGCPFAHTVAYNAKNQPCGVVPYPGQWYQTKAAALRGLSNKSYQT